MLANSWKISGSVSFAKSTLNYFFVARAVRVCAVCLPALGAGWSCAWVPVGLWMITTRRTMVTVGLDRIPSQSSCFFF